MTTSTYQCTICRRLKDVEQDNVRALPNQCTITKGCKGILTSVLGTPYVPKTSGLTDWYPRNKKPIVKVAVEAPIEVSMACSPGGMLTLGMLLTDAQALSMVKMTLEFNQRLASDISTLEYSFTTTSSTTVISGRDSQGKNLRFDQSAINNNQVIVLLNGVKTFNVSLSPNIVTFNSAIPTNSNVEVVVYSSAPSTKVYMVFNLNHASTFAANSSAWTNIRWVADDFADIQQSSRKWWIYSATSFGSSGSGAFLQLAQIVGKDVNDNQTILGSDSIGFYDARFLLAAPPYGNADRYLQFYLDCNKLASDFKMRTEISSAPTVHVEKDALTELYPPMILSHDANVSYSSYISANENTADGSTLSVPILTGQKIIGPI